MKKLGMILMTPIYVLIGISVLGFRKLQDWIGNIIGKLNRKIRNNSRITIKIKKI